MGDAVGWAEDEVLLWHLRCLGNGVAQHKGGTLPSVTLQRQNHRLLSLGVRRGAEL